MIKAEDLYYIRDTRLTVGNSVLWWKVNGGGYTCDLNEAWKVAADFNLSRDTDILCRCVDVDGQAEIHFDFQRLSHVEMITRDSQRTSSLPDF